MEDVMHGMPPWWGGRMGMGRMRGMKGGMFFGKLLMMHAEEMGITDDQMKKMRDLWMEFLKTKARMMGDMQVARIELKQMLMRDDVDEKAVEEHVKKIGQMKTDMMLEGIRTMLRGRDILTREQRKQFESLVMKTMAAMHGPCAGMGTGPGAGPEPGPGGHQHHHP